MTTPAIVENTLIPLKGKQRILYINVSQQVAAVKYQNAIITARNAKDGT